MSTHMHIIHIFLPINQLPAFIMLENSYKEMLKLGKSNSLELTKLMFLIDKHDYRSCAMVTFIFLIIFIYKKSERSPYKLLLRIFDNTYLIINGKVSIQYL